MDIVRQILQSKKALAAIAGVLVLLAGRIGLDLPDQTAVEITGIVISYILGQGIADINKVPQ
jgi:uncharacterized membrane protein (DUF441 family)